MPRRPRIILPGTPLHLIQRELKGAEPFNRHRPLFLFYFIFRVLLLIHIKCFS